MTAGPHILIVEAPFYADIVEELRAGAEEALAAAGATVEHASVPGAFEVPAVISIAADTGRYDGYVALGCVIRGETSHYDYVCAESARGLQDLAVDRRLAIGYGILTTDDDAQAWVRARRDEKNKGRDAAEACLAMIALKRRFAGEV
ncbi:MAG: 6,7-dimethyl-8-ribityllumazine synthase [Pseudomonadota bacterium]